MTTDTPKDETPQDYPVTIERIDLPDDLPQDDRSGIYAPVIPQADASSPKRTSQGYLIGSVIHYANGDLTVSSDTLFETPEERGARLAISRQAEAQRLKGRLSQIPWHAKRAAKEGDAYWLRLAQSYQGD